MRNLCDIVTIRARITEENMIENIVLGWIEIVEILSLVFGFVYRIKYSNELSI